MTSLRWTVVAVAMAAMLGAGMAWWRGRPERHLSWAEAALAALESVTRLDPKDARVWRTLGMIFKENVEYERAAAAFKASLAIDRAQPAVRLDLAETLLKLGDAAGAERELSACKGRVSEA